MQGPRWGVFCQALAQASEARRRKPKGTGRKPGPDSHLMRGKAPHEVKRAISARSNTK